MKRLANLMLPPLLCPVRHWQPLVPERTGVTIEDMEVFAGYCLIQERRDGRPALSILRLPPSAASRAASTPDVPCVGHLSCERHAKQPALTTYVLHSCLQVRASARTRLCFVLLSVYRSCNVCQLDASCRVVSKCQDVRHALKVRLGSTALRALLFRPEAGALALAFGANPDFHATAARVLASSPLRPDVPLSVDLANGCVSAVEHAAEEPLRLAAGSSCGQRGGNAEQWAEVAEAFTAGEEHVHFDTGLRCGAACQDPGPASGGDSESLSRAETPGSPALYPTPGSNPNPILSSAAAARRYMQGSFSCWVERVRTADGALVPLTVARSAPGGPPGPVLLAVYGCYGLPLDLGYRPEYASLLVSYLFTHVLPASNTDSVRYVHGMFKL